MNIFHLQILNLHIFVAISIASFIGPKFIDEAEKEKKTNRASGYLCTSEWNRQRPRRQMPVIRGLGTRRPRRRRNSPGRPRQEISLRGYQTYVFFLIIFFSNISRISMELWWFNETFTGDTRNFLDFWKVNNDGVSKYLNFSFVCFWYRVILFFPVNNFNHFKWYVNNFCLFNLNNHFIIRVLIKCLYIENVTWRKYYSKKRSLKGVNFEQN